MVDVTVTVRADKLKRMTRPVSSIRNLGPALEAAFRAAGIRSAEEVHALGADAAYLRLIEAGTRPHFIGYYALAMGLQGRPWNDCRGPEKAVLRKRFEALKARAAANRNASDEVMSTALDRALAEIGVVARNGRQST
jgi:DNA transformation protein